MDNVSSVWDDAESIMDYTDVDLEYSREWSSRIYDPDMETQQLVYSLLPQSDLQYDSEVIDRAVRIEVAHTLDTVETSCNRDRYDIKWMIPPEGWVAEQTFEEVQLVPLDDLQYDSEYIQFSSPMACKMMIETFIEEGHYEIKRDVAKQGLKRMAGRLK